MRFSSRCVVRTCKSPVRNIGTWSSRDLFEYTSGRFLFNQKQRLSERRLRFNVEALATAICNSTNRPVCEPASITKLAEGGLNRVLQATFHDGTAVIARLPYSTTAPRCRAVASEAATIDVLHSRGLPVPRVLGYSPDTTSPVGAEYLLLEKLEGAPLSKSVVQHGQQDSSENHAADYWLGETVHDNPLPCKWQSVLPQRP